MLEAIHRNTRVVVDLSIIKQNISKIKYNRAETACLLYFIFLQQRYG